MAFSVSSKQHRQLGVNGKFRTTVRLTESLTLYQATARHRAQARVEPTIKSVEWRACVAGIEPTVKSVKWIIITVN